MKYARAIEARHLNRVINQLSQVFCFLVRDRELFLPAFRGHVRIRQQ
jgi:hypothetical protein